MVCLLITYSVFLCQGSYLAVRKWNRTRIRPVHVLVKGKLESKIAYTTFWSTVFVGVSGVRILVVYLFRGASPFSRQISILRWAETYSVQLNLLFNPLLNWYRNRRFRKVTLELLRCRKRPATRTSRHTRQRPYSVSSLDIVKLQCKQRGAGVLRSESLGAMMCLHTFRQMRNEAVKERPMSAHTCGNHLIVTVQIENAPVEKGIHRKTGLPKNIMKLGSSRRHISFKICAMNFSGY